jgi:hypothetical protein
VLGAASSLLGYPARHSHILENDGLYQQSTETM